MFLITHNSQQCIASLQKLKNQLAGVMTSPVHSLPLGQHYLGWFSGKPSDNFHVYINGCVIGKVDFAEENTWDPIYHDTPLPKRLNPLLQSVIIRQNQDTVIVEPNGVANVFTSGSIVSDMQLLIADVISAVPSSLGVACLSSVGYFPGNMTLFEEIERIPFLHKYNLGESLSILAESFEIQKNDDTQMIERLVQIIPSVETQYLALSGGNDSRFVLGCLMDGGIKPILVHMMDQEDSIVTRVAKDLGLLIQCCALAERIPGYRYTLMTDAQLYFRGSHSSQIRKCVSPEGVYHTGLFADSLIKDIIQKAWKIPVPRYMLFPRLIEYGLLSTSPHVLHSLRQYSYRQHIVSELLRKLEYQKRYFDYKIPKVLANWFYYMNRGLRWSTANMSCLSYYTYPVFLLSDLTALSYGISSSAYSNFRTDRVRALNHILLPSVQTQYFNGLPAIEKKGILSNIRKIKYEYFDHIKERKNAKKNHHSSTFSNLSLFGCDFSGNESDGFSSYFTKSYLDILRGQFTYSEKRAAVTTNHVLKYLRLV